MEGVTDLWTTTVHRDYPDSNSNDMIFLKGDGDSPTPSP